MFSKAVILFLVNQEKLLAGLVKCLKNLSEQVHFQCSYFPGNFFKNFA